jgi:hypothetical protein
MEQSTKNSESVEGRLYNQEYRLYILANYKLLGLGNNRFVLPNTWFKMSCRLFCKESTIKYSDKNPSAVWIFEPVSGRTNTFYLKNKKFDNEYLRGSKDHQELMNRTDNWAVWTSKKNLFDDELYMWKFDRIENTDRYHIWNVKLGLPLYMRIFNGKNLPYMVSLKDGPLQDSENFEWVLKCLHDRDPVMT